MINWIISSFNHRVSKILFVLGSWNQNVELELCGSLFCYVTVWKQTVSHFRRLVIPADQLLTWKCLRKLTFFHSGKTHKTGYWMFLGKTTNWKFLIITVQEFFGEYKRITNSSSTHSEFDTHLLKIQEN